MSSPKHRSSVQPAAPISRGLTTWVGFCAAICLFAVSCTVGPDYERPELETGNSFKNPSGGFAKVPPAGDWWKRFNDRGLDRLIRDLESDSPSAEAALARYDQARAALGIARSDRFPSVTGDAIYRRERASQSGTFVPPTPLNNKFEAALNLDYEIDLWGKVRRSVEAARRELAASEAEAAAALLSLKAELARTWFQFRFLDEEIALVRSALELREENRKLIDARVRGGEATDLDLARARTEYETTRAQLLELQRMRDESSNALAALVGKPPSAFTPPSTGNPAAPPTIPAGVPSQLLARRPDVIAHEQRLAAATAKIGIAEANFLPSINLTGRGGLSSINASDFFKPTSLFGDIGPDIGVPLFRAGLSKNQKARAAAEARESAATYRETVITAIKETENALSAIRWLDQEIDAHHNAADAAADAALLSRKRYDGGLVSYLEVVDAERTRLAERRALTQTRAARQQAAVRLVQALGGGWNS